MADIRGFFASQGMQIALRYGAVVLVVGYLIGGPLLRAGSSEPAKLLPAPTLDIPAGSVGLATAVFAGGCFWGVQAVFQHVDGVASAVSGYAGGTKAAPTYEEVSSGATGHAELVELRYDPAKVSYGRLLQIFFSVAHDPTELNYQGPDSGTQYRSEIFVLDDAQKAAADAYIAELDAAKLFAHPIVTKVEPLKAFYPAEDYHQDYLINHPTSPYVMAYDLPKLDSLKKLFAGAYRSDAVRVAANRS